MPTLLEYTPFTGQHDALTQTYRYVIPASELNGTAGSVQLLFYYDDTDYEVTAYIYTQAPSGNAYDGELGSGVEITLGGSSPCSVVGLNTVSDVVNFNITGDEDIVIACHRNLAVAPYKSGLPTNCQVYHTVGVTEAAVAHVTGYGTYSSWPFIEKIYGYGEISYSSPSAGTPSSTPSSSPSATPSEATPSSSPSAGTPSSSPFEGTVSTSPSEATPSEVTPSSSPSAATPSSSPSPSPSAATPSSSPSHSPSSSPSSSPSEATPSTSPGGDTSLFYHDTTWTNGLSDWTGSRRIVISKDDLTNTPCIGRQLRIRFAYAGAPYYVHNVFVWKQATSGNAYDGESGSRVAVSKGGSADIYIDGSDPYSDPISFDVDGITNIVISMDGVGDRPCLTGSLPPNGESYYKPIVTGESGLADVSDFSPVFDWVWVESIEKIAVEGTPSDSPSAGTPSVTISHSPSEGTPSSSPGSSPSESTPSSSPSAGTPSASPTPQSLDAIFYVGAPIGQYAATTRAYRNVIYSQAFTGNSIGYKIRFKFMYRSSAYTVYGSVYKQSQISGGQVYDGDPATRVQLMKDGSSAMQITSDEDSYTDLLDFEITGTETIVVAIDRVSAVGPYRTEYSAYQVAYQKGSATESDVPYVTDYSGNSPWWYYLEGIYAETPSTPSPSPSDFTPSHSPSTSPSHGTPSPSPSEATPSSSPSSSPSYGTPSGSPSYGTPSGSPSEGSPSQATPSSSPSEATPSGDVSYIKTIELGIIGDGSTGSLDVKSLLIDNAPIGDFDFPLTHLPYSITSDDGKVQWKLLNKSYSSGGIPKNLEFEVLPTNDVPDGFVNTTTNKTDMTNQLHYYVATRNHGSYSYYRATIVGDNLWLVEGEFISKWELDNNMQVTYYKIPPHYYSEIDYDDTGGFMSSAAFTYCEYDGLFHMVGGPGSTNRTSQHSTFNPETGVYVHEALAPAPRKVYTGYMFDASALNGKLYYFCDENNASTYEEARIVWWYDVKDDVWGSIPGLFPEADGPEVATIIRDPYMTGHFLLIGYGYKMYRFNPAVTTYTPAPEYFELVDDSGYIYGYKECFAFVDDYTGFVCIGLYSDMMFWDPMVGVAIWQDDYVDDWLTDTDFKWQGDQEPWDLDTGTGVPIPGSNNTYHLATNDWDYYDNWALYSLNKSIKLRWNGHG